MAIKWILTQGIGFTPASVKYIPTLGFISSAAVAATPRRKGAIPVVDADTRMF